MSYSHSVSSGSSFGNSESSSNPVAVQTPQSDFELQSAQWDDMIAQSVYGWAQGGASVHFYRFGPAHRPLATSDRAQRRFKDYLRRTLMFWKCFRAG